MATISKPYNAIPVMRRDYLMMRTSKETYRRPIYLPSAIALIISEFPVVKENKSSLNRVEAWNLIITYGKRLTFKETFKVPTGKTGPLPFQSSVNFEKFSVE